MSSSSSSSAVFRASTVGRDCTTRRPPWWRTFSSRVAHARTPRVVSPRASRAGPASHRAPPVTSALPAPLPHPTVRFKSLGCSAMTSVAIARPAATVRPGAAARVATAAARPGAPPRAPRGPPRAGPRARLRASPRGRRGAKQISARVRGPPRLPVRRGRRGGSLVAGGAETSSSAETSAAETAGDDVDALAERLDKLKEKSQAMLAEAEALEKTATATGRMRRRLRRLRSERTA